MKNSIVKIFEWSDAAVASLCERRFRRSQTAATKTAATFCVAAAVACAACQSHAALVTESTSTPVAIPDNSPDAGAASGIYIAPTDSQLSGIVNPSVASMSLTFTITGGWDGDYTLVLKH